MSFLFPHEFNELLEALGAFFLLYGVAFGVSVLGSLALYLLQAFGLFEMSKTLSLKHPWLSFIPFASTFALGRIAENYEKQNGKKSAKLGVILLVLKILLVALLLGFLIALVIAVVFLMIELGKVQNIAPSAEILSPFIASAILYILALGVGIAYNVLYFVSLWRIFSIFQNANATLFTVLSIFFSFLSPIFIFILRKKAPKLTFIQRAGLEPTEVVETY